MVAVRAPQGSEGAGELLNPESCCITVVSDGKPGRKDCGAFPPADSSSVSLVSSSHSFPSTEL